VELSDGAVVKGERVEGCGVNGSEAEGASVGVAFLGAMEGASVGYGAKLPSSTSRMVQLPPSGLNSNELPLPLYVPVMQLQAESQAATLSSVQLNI
jgi:hypothetical protein